jgi:hypothetical protein
VEADILVSGLGGLGSRDLVALHFLGQIAIARAFQWQRRMRFRMKRGQGKGAVRGTIHGVRFRHGKIAHKRAQKVQPPAEAVAGAGGFVKTGPSADGAGAA